MKKATTIEEQIAKLKERGMLISDEKHTSELLLDIGYYRLGFYWFPMEKSYPNKDRRNHDFKTGASFDKSVRLYEFDKKLRNILSFYIYDLEINLRTKVVYHVSNRHKDNPIWFSDNSIVMLPFINQLKKKYTDEIRNNDVIARHHANHPNHEYAPAWKTLEYISFGDLIRLIDNLKSDTLRKEIYNFYGISDDKTFPNYIDIIRQMRNRCAHGHPIFDLKLSRSLRAAKFKTILKGDQGNLWSSLSGVLMIIQYFLFYLPGDKGIRFSDEIKKLMNQHHNEDIMEYVGYLNDIPWLKQKL
jgi:abortive infection bacteriophage resistance protein